MQPQLCSRCKKNIAVVFITRQENGQNVNEGLCLKCAKNLGLPQVDEMMRRMGITDEDLDNISNEMMGAFGGVENLEGLTDADDPDADNEDEDGKTATFPFLSRFFGGNPAANDAQNGNEAEQTQSPRSNKKVEKGSKHKFLDSYWRDDVHRVSQAHGKGPRARAPLPAGHGQRAEHGGHAQDFEGHRPLL